MDFNNFISDFPWECASLDLQDIEIVTREGMLMLPGSEWNSVCRSREAVVHVPFVVLLFWMALLRFHLTTGCERHRSFVISIVDKDLNARSPMPSETDQTSSDEGQISIENHGNVQFIPFRVEFAVVDGGLDVLRPPLAA
jgi:hypothetical protein